MPATGLLALLDDITSLLDDVATMTKVASSKTAAVVGDDLALNAKQLLGTASARELPVVATVAKGSLVNKALLIPAALLISVFLPSLIKPLLMVGGAFLCFEGAEKVLHKVFHQKRGEHLEKRPVHTDPTQIERERIKGAVRTDFILSAEILVIALGAAAGATLPVQAMTLCVIGLGMTILVYGTVALIIKADDFGLFLQRLQGESIQTRTARSLGRGIIVTAPKLMKLLSFLGTAAIFLVGGEIIAHGIPPVEHMLHHGTELISSLAPFDSESLRGALNLIAILGLGFFVGLAIVTAVGSVKKLHALYLLKK